MIQKTLVLSALLVFLAGFAFYYRQKASNYQIQAELYRHNADIAVKSLRKVYDEKIILEQRKNELENAATKDKGDFDWYRDISDCAVIKRLRQN